MDLIKIESIKIQTPFKIKNDLIEIDGIERGMIEIDMIEIDGMHYE